MALSGKLYCERTVRGRSVGRLRGVSGLLCVEPVADVVVLAAVDCT